MVWAACCFWCLLPSSSLLPFCFLPCSFLVPLYVLISASLGIKAVERSCRRGAIPENMGSGWACDNVVAKSMGAFGEGF